MPLSKAHRYLAGYINAGLVEQDLESAHYRLGPLALEIGLAAIKQVDVVAAAKDELARLQRDLQQTVSLCIWSAGGPLVISWLPGSQPVTLNTELGRVLPISVTANGFAFAAFLDKQVTAPIIEAEVARFSRTIADRKRRRATLRDRIEHVRQRGYSIMDGDIQAGIAAVGAPIFQYDRRIVGALAVLGIRNVLDVSRNGEPVTLLRAAARRISKRLGFPAERDDLDNS